MPALPFPERIHTDSDKSVAFSSISAQFGNGYSQRAASGLNNVIDSFTILWPALNVTDKDILVSTLESVGNWDVLTWAPPAESSEKKFTIKQDTGYSIEYVAKRFNVRCELTQVFDL